MAEPVKMSASAVIAAAVSGAIFFLVGSEYSRVDPTPEPTQTSGLLSYATQQCRDEVMQVGPNPTCDKDGETYHGKSKVKSINLWQCNGAIMPQRVQSCLDKAVDDKDKAEKDKKEKK